LALVGAGFANEATDIYEALTVENVALDLDRVQLMAKLESAGYTFEVPGQALGDGETLALYEPTDEDIVIYDPDGNLLSTEEKDALLDGGELPTEFVGEEGLVPPVSETIGPPQIFGVADQYSSVGSNVAGPDGYQGALDEADARDRGPYQEYFINTKGEQVRYGLGGLFDEEKRRQAELARNPYVGGLPEDYRRLADPKDEFRQQTSRTQYGSIDRYYTPEQVAEFNDKKGTPTYRQDDILGEVAKWDTWDIIEFQEKALEAGLINPEALIDGMKFMAGTLDSHTVRALESAMARANVNGSQQTYNEAIDWIIEQQAKYKELFGDKDGPPPWTPPRAYFDLDYATISNDFKVTMEQKLGRKANQWEIDLAADAMRSNHRAAYDEAMSADKAVYEAQGRATEYDTPQQVEGSYTEVDEDARFAEDFRERYGTELDQRDRQIRMEEDSVNLFSGLSQLSRLGGGV
jgi:hypothetical protein